MGKNHNKAEKTVIIKKIILAAATTTMSNINTSMNIIMITRKT